MPYVAENKIQADNGLQFWRDQLPPEYTKEIHSLGQKVFIKSALTIEGESLPTLTKGEAKAGNAFRAGYDIEGKTRKGFE